jgi:hypothetical protein
LIKETVLKPSEFKKLSNEKTTEEKWIVSIMEKCNYDYETMKQTMENELKIVGGIV